MNSTLNTLIPGSSKRPIVLDYYIPLQDKPKDVVVFCHGYKGFKDWGGWHLMAEAFYKAGIAFIKFNFSHNGGTPEQPIDFPDLEAFGLNNYSIEMDDLQLVLDWITLDLGAKHTLDLSKITLLGHSRGGGIVTLTAAQDSRINKVVSLASVCDYKSRFLEGTPHFDAWKNSGITYVENTRTGQQLPHYFQFYTNFIANQERLTIKAAAQAITIPHLIIHGTADTSVTPEEAHKLHQWNPKSELYLINSADHVFGMQHPWNNNELPEHMQKVIDKTLDFIYA